MKADISLAERRRIEREQQAEIRAMLAPRHFATMREQMAIDETLARLEREALIEAAPAITAIMAGVLRPCPHLWSFPNLNPLRHPFPCRWQLVPVRRT
ncbi:MAG TPA: hypothetical protein VFX27_08845, partial [Sphingobium sp.]|nr:hypothetical protein [Sphingobium sp.]